MLPLPEYAACKQRGLTAVCLNYAIGAVLITLLNVISPPVAAGVNQSHHQPNRALTANQLTQRIVPGEPINKALATAPVFKNVATALCRASARGSIDATVKLGWMHVEGAGVSGDLDIAASLFSRAAAHGNPTARNLVAAFPTTDDRLPECLKQAQARPPSTEAPRKQVLKSRSRLARTVARMARRYRLDPRFVLAIVQIESAFRPDALSPQNAAGLMQLTPDTAKRFGVNDVNDPIQNLHGGMAYLRWLLAYFEGDVTLVAAAYNSGEGSVNKYGGVPPFVETMNYVAKLKAIYHRDWHPYNRRYSTKPSPVVARIRRESIPPILEALSDSNTQTIVLN